MKRKIAILLLLALGLLWLFPQEQRVQIEQIPQPPIRLYRYYLPMVVKDYPRHPLRGVAASGNGGYAAIIQTGASWYYNWSHQPSWDLLGVEFVPLVGWGNVLPDVIADSEYLLTLNEPNIVQQSNVCPKEFVETWREIENRWGNRKLVSPGVGWGGNTICLAPDGSTRYYINGMDWLTDFREYYLEQYGEFPKLDVIAFHCYRPPEAPCSDIAYATNAMVTLADAWDIPEVWLTEFDSGDFGAQDTANLTDALNYFATVPKLTHIAYYQDYDYPNSICPTCTPDDNSALTDRAGKLTEYGIIYSQ